ncbi:MAG: nucleotidyltransferase family protein [Candidatus Bilamarchaeaceae archaeon]
MKAIILCGGEGTRLRPYTYTIPKAMLPVGGRPILEYIIEHLRESKITDIVLSVGYLREKIMGHFEDGRKFGVKIDYFIEEEALSTAGAIFPHRKKLNKPFLVLMGDQITNIDLKKMEEAHKRSGAIATIAAKTIKTPLEYGALEVSASGQVSAFREKPVLENLINTGIYILEPEALEYIRPKEDFAKDVFPRMLKSGKNIHAYIMETEFWIDIGRVSDYERIRALFPTGGIPQLGPAK